MEASARNIHTTHEYNRRQEDVRCQGSTGRRACRHRWTLRSLEHRPFPNEVHESEVSRWRLGARPLGYAPALHLHTPPAQSLNASCAQHPCSDAIILPDCVVLPIQRLHAYQGAVPATCAHSASPPHCWWMVLCSTLKGLCSTNACLDVGPAYTTPERWGGNPKISINKAAAVSKRTHKSTNTTHVLEDHPDVTLWRKHGGGTGRGGTGGRTRATS